MLNIQQTVGIDCVPLDTKVLRVFDKEKYEKLFSDSAIWFSSIDALRANCDPLERTIPESFFKRMRIDQRKHYDKCNEIKDRFYKTFISCWSMKECEALWVSYDKYSNGFAIVSSVKKLCEAFSPKPIIACKVQYIDLNRDEQALTLPWVLLKDETMEAPVSIRLKEMFKNGTFIEDDEIRFIGFDKANEGNANGINIRVDLSKLIDGAIINPRSDDDTQVKVKKLLHERGITVFSCL